MSRTGETARPYRPGLHEPMAIAGLWSWWQSPKGELIHSHAMLTINAKKHRLMNRFHKSTDEKRMVVILPEKAYQDWLEAPLNRAKEFLMPYSADAMVAMATQWWPSQRRVFERCRLPLPTIFCLKPRSAQ